MFKYKQEFKVFEPSIRKDLKMNYLLAVPEDLKEDEKLPLIVFLHGAGERGQDPQKIKVHGIPRMVDNGLNVRAVILAPQVPYEYQVWNSMREEAIELIRYIRDTMPVDYDRVSLTGISMGGYGTWEIGMCMNSELAAIAPVCGGGMPWRVDCLRNMPIRAYHGDKDDIVPLSATMEMVDKLISIGGQPECCILHNVGHCSWDFAYYHTDLVEWLASKNLKERK